jgi:hypothetical protein
MGSKVIAECECGFITPKMRLGGGMYCYTTVNTFPNYCKNCSSLFLANMFDNEIVCTNCKSHEVVPYNDSYVAKGFDRTSFNWGDLKLYSENNLCPECNQFFLKFRHVGMWD